MKKYNIIRVTKGAANILCSGSEYNIEYSNWGEFPKLPKGVETLGYYSEGSTGRFIPPCSFNKKDGAKKDDCVLALVEFPRDGEPSNYAPKEVTWVKELKNWMSLDQFYYLMDRLPGDENEKLSLATKAASLRYPVKGWLPEREAAKELGEKLEAYKALGFREGMLEDYSFECC